MREITQRRRGHYTADTSEPRDIKKLEELVDNDELLIDLVVDNLPYHRTLADQVGVKDLLRLVRDNTPQAVLDVLARRDSHAGTD